MAQIVRLICLGVILAATGCGEEPAAIHRRSTVGVAKLLGEQRYEEAVTICRDLLQQSPDNVSLLELHGELCLKLRREDEAKVIYARLLELDPYHRDARLFCQRFESVAQDSRPRTSAEVATYLASFESRENSEQYKYAAEQPNVEEDPGMPLKDPSRKPQLNAAETAYRKFLNGVSQVQQKQAEANMRTELAPDYDPRVGWDAKPMDRLPPQVFRSDLGLGGIGIVEVGIPRVPTTGHYSPLEMLQERPRSNRMLAGQALPLAANSPCMAAPASPARKMPSRDLPPSPSPFECSDRRDNDGDGLADRFDPDCWVDPLVPRSYQPYRLEHDLRVSAPSAPTVPGAPVAVSATPSVPISAPAAAPAVVPE